ncbi:type II toxin-antitoxin system VapC family toxin [soil metagenome]
MNLPASNLLVDTHLLLWAAGEPHRLSPTARRLLADPQSHLWFSAASLWEIALKHGLGRDDFRVEPRRLRRGLIDNGWHELAISSEHAVATLDLPALHKDPFDRLLVAQAKVEGLSLVTSDELVARYPGDVQKV